MDGTYLWYMHRAISVALSDSLNSDWARSSWLTQVVQPLMGTVGTFVGFVVLPLDLIWSIPRAILTKLPYVSVVYLWPIFLVMSLLLLPLLGLAAVWRAVPVLRAPLIPFGLLLVVLGEAFVTVAFMGGPGQEGAWKIHRRWLFGSWPVTSEFSNHPSIVMEATRLTASGHAF